MRTEDEDHVPVIKRPPESLLKRILLDAAGKEYGTPQGQMLIRGQINRRQYAACNWFERLYERYLAALGRSRGIRTSTGERYDRGHDPDPISPAGIEMAASEAASVSEYTSARLTALAGGHEEYRHFWDIIIEGNPPTAFGRLCVVRVATALDKHRSRGWRSRRRT